MTRSEPRPPGPAPADAVERALVRLRRSMTRRHLRRRADPRGVLAATAVFDVLDALEERELGVSGIAAAVGVDQPRASRLVARAVDHGLAERAADPADGRRQVIRLTTAGRQALAAAHRTRRRAVAASLRDLGSDDARTFARLLPAFVDAWERRVAGSDGPGKGADLPPVGG